MVMAELQVSDVDVLKAILALHIDRQRLPWRLFSYLKITMRRPYSEEDLDAAPDLMLAATEDHRRRTSWNLRVERKPPEFALEVSSDKSWGRDTKDKPRIYRAMGVREYAVFAPERTDGPKLFGHRRDATGAWVNWRTDERGVLWSRALGGFGLYIEGGIWLRAVDEHGNRLPTPREWAEEEAARREAEWQRARAEAARAEAGALRAAQEAARAEAEMARAEAEAARADAETTRAAEERKRREAAEADALARADELAHLREELRRLRTERREPPTGEGN